MGCRALPFALTVFPFGNRPLISGDQRGTAFGVELGVKSRFGNGAPFCNYLGSKRASGLQTICLSLDALRIS
jgi:hypothetical protein